MEDNKKLEALKTHSAPCMVTLGGKPISFSSNPAELSMTFLATDEFCHSDNKIVQGGFITGMLDACMAHLVICLNDMKVNPMTLDLTVNFLASSHPGELEAIAKIVKLGKSIGFLSAELFQNGKIVATSTSTVKLVYFN
ncbi:MAG: PaaI family thioesterase [Gammaproteobacteria bacterium]